MTRREITDMLDALRRRRRCVYPGRLLREGSGLTLHEVAAMTGVSHMMIRRLELGEFLPGGPGGIRWARLIRDLDAAERMAAYHALLAAAGQMP